MSNIGKYIYGIVSRISNPQAEAAIEALGLEIISEDDFSAVAETAEIVDYNIIPQNEVVRRLLNHQRKIEGVMSCGHSIIPFKLGAFARNNAEIRKVIAENIVLLPQIMAKIHGKIEINLLASWRDFQSIVKKIGMCDDIRELKEKLLAGSMPVTSQDQLQIGMLVKRKLMKMNRDYATIIYDYTSSFCSEFKSHEIINDQIVFNTSFLIDHPKERQFNAKLEELNTRFNDELNFKYVGPLPCYSFYSLEVNRINFEIVDCARKKLGLTDCATKDDIKKLYKEKVAYAHPDRNPGKIGMENEFNEIISAYKVINDYCKVAKPVSPALQYSFQKQDVNQNTIYVKLKE